jgi:hypothetical protein
MTTDGTLDERYLIWLHQQLEPDTQRNPARSHWLLCVHLFKTEFTWFVPNDNNRLLDGLDIRQRFIDEEEGGDVPGIWLGEPCTVLEMLIALAERMAYSSDKETDYWFWTMLENAGLRRYVDEIFDDDAKVDVEAIVQAILNREYHADGSGGLFPLRHGGRDQRQLELWYQMSQYLLENVDI